MRDRLCPINPLLDRFDIILDAGWRVGVLLLPGTPERLKQIAGPVIAGQAILMDTGQEAWAAGLASGEKNQDRQKAAPSHRCALPLGPFGRVAGRDQGAA